MYIYICVGVCVCVCVFVCVCIILQYTISVFMIFLSAFVWAIFVNNFKYCCLNIDSINDALLNCNMSAHSPNSIPLISVHITHKWQYIC